MARTLTPKDAYAIMNLLVAEATGAASITATDLSSFVSAGELVLATGTENVLNSLSLVLGRTMVASRPYKARLDLMEQVDTGLYSSRIRKISYYGNWALPSGAFNTDLFTNFSDGYTNGQNTPGSPNSTKSMWEQNPKYPLELNFGGSNTWQYCITRYEVQLQTAFRTPEDFNAFISGYLTESANDIESMREAWNRMALLNKIAATYEYGNTYSPKSVVNLTYEFNQRFNTSYSSSDLLSTYLKEFLAFFVSTVKIISRQMEHRTVNFHWTPPKTDANNNPLFLFRHTPRERQRMYLYAPLFVEAESWVLPEIFNDEYLSIDDYQGVDWWQNPDAPMSINVTPAVVDVDTTSPTYGTQIAGSAVSLDYVIGMITDVDGLMTNFQLESVDTTILESRKKYRNIWHTFLRNQMQDPTENVVIFVMEDPVNPGGSKEDPGDQKEEPKGE